MKSSCNREGKKGPGRPKGTKNESRSPEIQGGRRITRLQSKLNSLPLHSSDPLINCSKVPSWVAPPVHSKGLIGQHHEHSLSAKRLKEAPNVSKPVAAITPVENLDSEGLSIRNGLDLFPSRPVTSGEVNASSVHLILGKYTVKEALEPTIRSIIEKHGDIVANSHMETPRGRSGVLDNFAEFIKNFETKTFAELSESEIDTAIQIVSYFSKVGLDVGWLQQRLKDLLEARRTIKQYSTLKEIQQKKVEAVKEKSKALKIDESRLVLLKKQLNAAEEQVNAAKKELDAEEADTKSLQTTISNVVNNVKYFNAHPPLHGLL